MLKTGDIERTGELVGNAQATVCRYINRVYTQQSLLLFSGRTARRKKEEKRYGAGSCASIINAAQRKLLGARYIPNSLLNWEMQNRCLAGTK